MEYLLTLLIFFPAIAALLALMVHENIKSFAIVVSALEFALALILWANFDSQSGEMQFVHHLPIMASYGISYFVGVDGISLFLVVLATFISLIGFIVLNEQRELKNLVVSLLFLETIMVGVFSALDAILFYIFWELSLVPMLYIIGAWGSGARIYAAIKFFLYTFTGSLIMLIGMLYFAYTYYETTGIWTFSILDWQMLILPLDLQKWLFIAFFAGIAIKVPMFPFHTWLPYAHGQAPTIGSVILAAVLLKMGTYGFVRLSLPLFPDASVAFALPVAILCLFMIIYGAMVAYAQEDMKQVIAYSSISHMGVIVLGTFALNAEGIGGSIFFMISHGIVSGALFMLVGVIYDRRHTKMIAEFGGLAHVMPRYATIFAIMMMASAGLPLTMGFVGEFLSLLGFFAVSPWIAFLAGSSIVLGAVYMLVLFKRVFFGNVTNSENAALRDLDSREIVALLPLVMIVVWLGIYPKPLLSTIDVSVKNTIELMQQKARTPEAKERLGVVEKGGE